MNIKPKQKSDGAASPKLVLFAVLIALIIMVTVYFVGAQFRSDNAEDTDGAGVVAGDENADGADSENGDGADSDQSSDDFPIDTDETDIGTDETSSGEADDTVDVDTDTDKVTIDTDADETDGGDGTDRDTADEPESDTDDTTEPEVPDEIVCEHSWDEADCKNPKTCSICGVTEGDPIDHTWREATCESPEYCSLCGEIGAEKNGHSWADATCEKAKMCSVCGEVDGKSLGHVLGEATCTEASVCERCGKAKGDPLGHDYKSATCTEVSECKRCGKTKGEALGHDYKPATCTKASECKRCGKTDGEVLGHDYRPATCTEASECSRCGKTSGSALGHKWEAGACTACGAADPDALIPNPDSTKPLYIGGELASGVEVIYSDGKSYVPVVKFSSLVDAGASHDTSDNGKKCSVSASGLTLSAKAGNSYIEANGRVLPCDKIVSEGGAVAAPIEVLAKVFGASVTYPDGEVHVTKSSGYITSGNDYYDSKTLDLLSRIVNSEAGEESFFGKLAVCSVILNRVSNSEFPNTVYDVIHQKNQFTVVNTDAFNETPNADSVRAAKMCMEGYRYDKRVLFFDSTGDSWASENKTFLYKIGNQYFYG